MRKPVTVLVSVLAFAAAACSSSEGDKDGQKSDQTKGEWNTIVEGSWALGAGEEKERDCFKHELKEDVWVTSIRPIHPFGTHHTLLTLGDEDSECTSQVASGLLYAAGVGSEGLELPPGVAIKLPKGQFLNLGLHIYNPTEEPIEGTSGIQIQTTDAESVEYQAEAVLAGPISIRVEPGETKTIAGTCKVETDQHLFALFPHMHQLGTHFKTTLNMGGKDTVIHDGAYDFEEQYQLPLDPIYHLKPNDTITTECTYENTLNKVIGFGESSDREMCFSILFRYPAQGEGFCTGGSGGGGASIPSEPCAKEGDPGNDVGVGKLCTKKGGECESTKTAGLCLADVVSGGFANFCTQTCETDEECGEGASCFGAGEQSICIPTACTSGSAAADGGAP